MGISRGRRNWLRSRYGLNQNEVEVKLKNYSIKYKVYNNGHHFALEERIDYWPSTGTFIDRKSKFRDYGLKSLLEYFNKIKEDLCSYKSVYTKDKNYYFDKTLISNYKKRKKTTQQNKLKKIMNIERMLMGGGM